MLIGLGAIVALVILSFPDQRASPGVIAETAPLATCEGDVAQSIATAVRLEQASQSTTENDSLSATGAATTGSATAPPIGVQNAPSTAAPAAPESNISQSAAEPASDADEFTELPLGWCFRTWPGPGGPWLAMSPPGEPTHELRTDSRVVWNGSRSAWLGTESSGSTERPYADVMWQTIDATRYRGSRIELSAQFRDLRSDGSIQLFLRTQRATEREIVLLGTPPQNMWFGQLGDSWWRPSVVSDVPTDADVLVVGIAVYNRGHVWIDEARLTRVSTSTPLTNNPLGGGERFAMPLAHAGQRFNAPTNFDFEATNLDPAGLPLEPGGC